MIRNEAVKIPLSKGAREVFFRHVKNFVQSPFLTILFSIIPTILVAQSQPILKNNASAAIDVRLASPENIRSEITIRSINSAFVSQGKEDTLRISWIDNQRRCRIRYSTSPGGGDPAAYPEAVNLVGQGRLDVGDVFPDLPVGIYYCILQDVDTPDETSIEFPIFVQPPAPVRVIGPENTLNLDNDEPIFSWAPISGVPYYYLVVSQGELSIETDPETGEIENIVGINVVWQAFTQNSSIRYGETDLSGFWPDQNTPPLIPGETYSWVVFSAFAPDLRNVTFELFPLFATQFEVAANVSLPVPQILTPGQDATVSTDQIDFRWRGVPGATRYRVVLQELIEDENLGEGSIVLWQKITVDTSAQFLARDFIIGREQTVTVFAENPRTYSASPPRTFSFQSSKGTLQIRSVDRATGAAIPFADIEISRGQGVGPPFSLFTGFSGNIEFDAPSGDYTISSNVRGYAPSSVDVELGGGQNADAIVRHSPAQRLVLGRVVEPDGSPVPFAEIATAPSAKPEKADGLGFFALAADDKPASLFVSAFGFSQQEISVPAFDALGLANIGDIVLTRGDAKVSGTLLDENGLPLSGVRFKLENQGKTFEVVNGRSESYEFSLPAGAWKVQAAYEGYHSIPPSYTINLQSGQTAQASFTFSRAAMLEGRVFADNQLTAGATVTLTADSDGKTQTTTSDNFGVYSFDAPAGLYQLTAVKDGFAPFQTSVQLLDGMKTELDVTLSRASIIWGTVRTEETQAPLTNVEIVATSNGQALAVTDANGVWSFIAEAGRAYLLDASLPGFVSDGVMPVSVAEGDSARVDFLMNPASAVIRGLVRNADGAVANAQVNLIGRGRSIRTDEQGLFEISVEPGDYSLQAMLGCQSSQIMETSVALGQAADIVLELTGVATSVTGFVFDQFGQPIFDASIFAAGQENFTARTDSSGAYQLCLEPGPYFLLASRVGYANQDTSIIVANVDSLGGVNFFLPENFGTIQGRVQSDFGEPLSGVQVIFVNTFQQIVTSSNAAGIFTFEKIIPGEATIFTRSDDFFADPLNVVVPARETIEPTITMFRNDGFLSGRILDGFTDAGIEGALVVAQVQGTATFVQALSTAPNGEYRIDGLPVAPGRVFRVLASKEGFRQAAPLDSVEVNQENIDFALFATNATIGGTVVSADENLPVSSATVRLLRPGEITREFQTGDDGAFLFSGLTFTFEYSLEISHPNFKAQVFSINAPNDSLQIALDRIFSFMQGRVTRAGTDDGFPDARVIFASLDAFARSDTTTSGLDGRFFAQVFPGQYRVLAQAPLFFSTPSQHLVELAPNDTSVVLDFSLESQVLASLAIQGPTEILGGEQDGSQYSVAAVDTAGRSVNSVPNLLWSVDLGADTASVSSTGFLSTDSGYIGDLKVSVLAEEFGVRDTLEVNVLGVLRPEKELRFFGRFGQRIEFAENLFNSQFTIRSSVANLLPLQNVEEDFRIVSEIFRISPENIEFEAPAVFSLPVPAGVDAAQVTILRWNNLLSVWEDRTAVESVATSDSGRVAREILQGGDYALAEFSAALGILDLQITPNPFSPTRQNQFGEPGVAIAFSVTSNRVALPSVTAKIYNLEGQLVAILADRQPVFKGPQHFSWGGTTIDGRQARNGRYILHFSVNDGDKKKEQLKSLVLIR